MYPHKIERKSDQKQQFNKITINTRVKPRHYEGIK